MSDLHSELPPADFDREPELEELLAGIDGPRLMASLRQLAGGEAAITDPAGRTVLGQPPADPVRVPLRLELEPVGSLCVDARVAGAGRALAALVELILRSAQRYRMASELHLQAVQEDYRRLQAQHAALQASEQRYRELSRQLEQRVAEQVATIETAQRQLYQAEKLASVGQLAAGVAHEINNPLGFVRSNLATAGAYLGTLKTYIAEAEAAAGAGALDEARARADLDTLLPDFDSILEESIEGVDRVARIVRDLKDFSNVDRSEEEVIDLNRLLESVCNVAANELQQCQLHVEHGDLPPLRCRPGHLGQVFLNLLLNAAAAVAPGGHITLSSRRVGDHIEVVVADDGPGIPAEVIDRVFDPFFTTREVGAGTGLGLTVARDIVTAHGGRIVLDSAPGQGTRVAVSLPLQH